MNPVIYPLMYCRNLKVAQGTNECVIVLENCYRFIYFSMHASALYCAITEYLMQTYVERSKTWGYFRCGLLTVWVCVQVWPCCATPELYFPLNLFHWPTFWLWGRFPLVDRNKNDPNTIATIMYRTSMAMIALDDNTTSLKHAPTNVKESYSETSVKLSFLSKPPE